MVKVRGCATTGTSPQYRFSAQLAQSFRIQPHEDPEQDREADHAAAAVAEEWQGDPDHRCETDGHAHIDHQV